MSYGNGSGVGLILSGLSACVSANAADAADTLGAAASGGAVQRGAPLGRGAQQWNALGQQRDGASRKRQAPQRLAVGTQQHERDQRIGERMQGDDRFAHHEPAQVQWNVEHEAQI